MANKPKRKIRLEQVAGNKKSYTGQYLAEILKKEKAK